ncbi:MAG: c-type cytochrome [Thermomonas sp.]|uniref:c-type cytochrome n=1 Tax=Thermomonas sp. TaxID=1971895 RepID=UPI001EB29E0C|nr:c-type cytochrome [Thermomonas sp.]MBV2209586.1 c-type cytochrome [Thermomonas sp.]
MTKITMTLLALACALSLSACGGNASGEHAAADASTTDVPSNGLPKGNAAAGRELANKGSKTVAACASCHGADGNKPIDGMYPKIGGQYADYVAHALLAYRGGTRAGATADVMAIQAKGLSDQQIADLAAYFATAPSQLRDLQGAP